VYAFAFQIYGDFAGYSNIARGTSKLMGIELIENFRFPYLVRTPQEFWRHWHISLSTWLRDYLYIPLGGNRGASWRTNLNLMLTMVLGGLWHGAAWTFVLWGAYQGVLLIIYRQGTARFKANSAGRWGSPAGMVAAWFVMFHLTCAGWLVFRSRSVHQIANLSAALLHDFRGGSLDLDAALQLLFFTVPLLVVHAIEARRDDVLAVPKLPLLARYSLYAATVYFTLLFGNFGGAEFIYFQF
jgi:D-alanyl-lipoteichoic acid acyltransferase DltB (MBOAT superfamily)